MAKCYGSLRALDFLRLWLLFASSAMPTQAFAQQCSCESSTLPMQIKASMLEAIALVQHHAGLPIRLGSGGVQVAPIGLPGHMPRQTNAVLAHRMQCAALSIPDANHPGAICSVQCMSRPCCLSSHEVHLMCDFNVYMQATCPDRLA